MSGRGAGITQPHRLSPELSAIVGVKEVSFILIPSAFFDNPQFFLFSHFHFRSLNQACFESIFLKFIVEIFTYPFLKIYLKAQHTNDICAAHGTNNFEFS